MNTVPTGTLPALWPTSGLPGAFGDLHVREYGRERRLLGGTGIDTETDFIGPGIHVADTHLAEVFAVGGALDTIIIGPSGKTVPHGFDIGRNGCGGPIRVAVVGGHAAQVLKFLVFKFDRAFEPVVAVQVHHNTALVKALMTLGEVCLHHKTEVLFPGLHLKNRGVVVTEMIVCPLPEVGMRCRGNADDTVIHFKGLRLPGPLEAAEVNSSTVRKRLGNAVNRGILYRISTCANEKTQADDKKTTRFGHNMISNCGLKISIFCDIYK